MRRSRENVDDFSDDDSGRDRFLPVTTLAVEDAEKLTKPNDKWEPFLVGLSPEIILIVLRCLNSTDLMRISGVNRLAQWLARRVLIERYRTQLQDSLLWRYLGAIASDVAEVNGLAFVDYFRTTADIGITEENRVRYSTFSSCLNFAKNLPLFPTNWNGSKFNELADLQALAKTILKDYPEDTPTAPRTLIEFVNRCSAHYSDSECLKLWINYYILDAQLTTLMLFIRMVRVRNTQARPVDEIGWLINPQHNRSLNGFGLIALSKVIPDIFPRLVREAIRLFKQENKNAEQQERFKHIEALLNRLTEADLLRYIPTEYYQRQNPPNDPSAIYANYPYNVPSDHQRALLIEVIRADYDLLSKKMTQAVLFKIERTDYRQDLPLRLYKLNETRVIPLILSSSLLLKNVGQDGIVKILCILYSTSNDIRNLPVLWPFLTFEVINQWFAKDEGMTSCYAEFILSNEVILKSLTNEQIISIAQYLGPKEIVSVFDSPAFRARLEEDMARNDHRENKLLMQLIRSSKNFLYQIAQHDFAVGLLTRDEISAILFPKSGKCMLSAISFLLHKKGVISHLSSAQLLQAVREGHNCHRIVAELYLTQFNHDDLGKFSKNCFHLIESQNKVELNILLETLPTELEKRAEELTSAQWLTFASIHPQIGCFIVDRYPNKLEDRQLESLSRDYKNNAELLQKITRLIEARGREKKQREAELLARQEQQKQAEKRQLEERRAQEQERKRQQVEETQRKERDQKRLEHFGYPPKNPQPKSTQKQQKLKGYQPSKSSQTLQEKTPWAHYFRLAFFTTLGLVGFTLFLLGIGSAVGIPVIVTMTSTLFSFLPWSAALTSFVGGYLVYMVAAITAAVSLKYTSEVSNKSIPEKTPTPNKSSCSTASFFDLFDCWPQPSQTQDVSQTVTLSQLSFGPSPATQGVRPKPVLKRIPQGENDESRTFGFQ